MSLLFLNMLRKSFNILFSQVSFVALSLPQRRRWALPTCWVYRCRASKELLWQSIRSTTAQLGPTGPHIGNQQQILGAAWRIGDKNTSTGRPFGAALDPTKSYYSSKVQPLDVLTNFHPEMCLYVCLHLHVWFICLS